MSFSDTPVIDMTEMVRVKERELHDIHELRCHQLENMIDERDKLIADAAKRFGLLKDDFQYNLTLLEARDAEITRLSTVERELRNEVEEIEGEKLALSNRLNEILQKDMARAKKYKQDKEKTKHMLSELQQELESLRWSTSDEINSRVREVESLRKDLRRAALEREDSLLSQREELVRTYDQLLQGREREFADQENHIVEQVRSLEQRFQHLSAENSRLKTELSGALRDADRAKVMAAASEERCLEVEWRLRDAQTDSRDTEAELTRKLQTVEAELASSRQEMEELTNEHRRELDKVQEEAKRSKQTTALQLRHLDEAHRKSVEDVELLQTELSESQSREALAKREMEGWRERAKKLELREVQLTERLTALQDTSGGEQRRLEAEVAQLQTALDQLRLDHTETTAELRRCEQTLKDTREASAQKLIEARDQLLHLTRKHEQEKETEVANARAETEANLIAAQTDSDTAMHVEMETLRLRLTEKTKAAQELQEALDARTRECDEERMENDALRLRLRLHGATADGGQAAKPGGNQFADNRALLNLHNPVGAMSASPMFSEDMGPVSIPASPMSSPAAKHAINSRAPHQLHGSDEYNFKFGSVSPDAEVAVGGRSTGGVAMLDGGDLENKRLKAAIREMRKDAEDLQAEMKQVTDERDAAEARAAEMEDRLHLATAEVNRLRQERRRLMDVSNELRAVIHQLRSVEGVPPAGSVAPPPVPTGAEDGSRAEQSVQNDVANRENSSRNTQSLPTEPRALNSGSSAKVSGGSAKRATERETASQQAALQRLKTKQLGRSGSGGSGMNVGTDAVPRKVVNYAKSGDFIE